MSHEENIERRREAIRQAFHREAILVAQNLVPEIADACSKKDIPLVVNFDVNATASAIAIEMFKKGCA